ncbi:hypothetical protein DV515_00016839, partial [Chloebia gouldiae]
EAPGSLLFCPGWGRGYKRGKGWRKGGSGEGGKRSSGWDQWCPGDLNLEAAASFLETELGVCEKCEYCSWSAENGGCAENAVWLIVSLEEKKQCLRTLEEQNLVLNNQVSQCQFALQQAEQLSSNLAGQLQERNTQGHTAAPLARRPQPLSPPSSIHSCRVLPRAAAAP